MPGRKLESKFQAEFLQKVRDRIPEDDCLILKPETGNPQGIFDRVILLPHIWVGIEFKRNRTSTYQPNQSFYVQKASRLSLGYVVSPENEQEVLRELYAAYESYREARFPQP